MQLDNVSTEDVVCGGLEFPAWLLGEQALVFGLLLGYAVLVDEVSELQVAVDRRERIGGGERSRETAAGA